MKCPRCNHLMALHAPQPDGLDDFRANVFTPCCGVAMKLSTGVSIPAPCTTEPSAEAIERMAQAAYEQHVGEARVHGWWNTLPDFEKEHWRRIARAVAAAAAGGET